MKKSVHALLMHVWLPVLLLWVLSAPAAVAAPTLDGLWKGPLKMPGGELEVIFRLVSLTGGSYFATMDVPLQRVSRMSVQVEVRGDTVMFAADEAGSRFVGQLAADGKQVKGTWHQPGYQCPLTLTFAPSAINTAPKARLTPPYREEEVAYTNVPVNLKLGGMLTIPAGPGPFPAVVLVSDTGPQDRDATTGDYRPLGTLADFLTRRGIAVLRFDDRGVGASAGDFSSVTVSDLTSDVQAGLNYLRARPEIDITHIGVVGHGQGGNVALLTAALPLPPAFAVTLGAYGLPGNTIILQQQKELLRKIGVQETDIAVFSKQQQVMQDVVRQTPDSKKAREVLMKMMRQYDASIDSVTARNRAVELTSARYRNFLNFNPAILLNEVKCPVLLLNGAADTDVAADSNLSGLTKALTANHNITTKKLSGVNHLFQADPSEWVLVNGQPRETFSPAALELIRSWITNQAQTK
ncbi:alpha/beta fold hydrolase [Hymenobacter tibetensis]|uniref:Alpha/beta fold hydrolase n=1 Tax=Hymenobacter tibetensis TaxID=497967 RepID=A0ABY4CYT1_9BACT|nr:alpha/beta hydrolase [Hymenobacter tibetensis]UOG75426.1 alpha/beta fold hydrolase [Hymenobacter tibetensis]